MHTLFRRIKTRFYRLLRWSERYTKTDMVYLTKGGSWITLGQGFATVSGLVLTVAFANLLSQNDFGIYKYIIAFAEIIAVFSLTGLNTAVAQAVSRGYEGAFQEGVRTYLKWSIGIPLIGFAVAGYYYLQGNIPLALGFAAAGAFLPFIRGLAFYNAFLKGKQDFKTKSLYVLPRNIVPIGALLITLFLTSNPGIIALVYFASQAVIVAFLYFYTLRTYTPAPETDSRSIRFGTHVSIMNVFSGLTKNLDQILLFHFLGAAPVAVYTFAKAPIREISKPKKTLLQLAFPKLSQRSFGELKQSLPKRIALLYLIIIPLIGAYIFAAPYIFELLFPKYMESVIYTQVLSLSLLFMPITLLKETFASHMKTKQMYVTKLIVPTTKILSLVILLPLFGIWGAVAALLLTRGVGTMLTLILFVKTKTH